MHTGDRMVIAVSTPVSVTRRVAGRLGLVLMMTVLLVAPFAALEWFNSTDGPQDFPGLLFAFMSVHAALIASSFAPAVVQLWSGCRLRALNRLHWTGVAFGVALLWLYIGVVVDQAACFMGMPNCD